MKFNSNPKLAEDGRKVFIVMLFQLLLLCPARSNAEIVWNGDFADGKFSQYHGASGPGDVTFFSVPSYGRPVQYGGQNAGHVGNGDLLSLVASTDRTINGVHYAQGPTRGYNAYSAKFTVKNSSSGSEPADCDPTPADTCERRRSQLKMQGAQFPVYGALRNRGEWWVSFSLFVPSNWPTSGSGWGPILMGIKQVKDSYGPVGYFSIEIENNAWTVNHSWSDNPNNPGALPWQQQMFYSGNYAGGVYPNSGDWPDGVRDFPNVAQSSAALRSVKIGGWTDWIIHYLQDERGSQAGGIGFLHLWKREESGSWVQVLDIRPAIVTRGNMTFDRGIGYALTNSGAGTIIGLYMEKGQAWNSSADRVIYLANHKIGDKGVTFSEMSPDGSSPGSSAPPASLRPMPPDELIAE